MYAERRFKTTYIAPIIVGVFLLLVSVFVIDSHLDHQETEQEINYLFDRANNLLNEGHFEEAIEEYNKVLKISYSKFPEVCVGSS